MNTRWIRDDNEHGSLFFLFFYLSLNPPPPPHTHLIKGLMHAETGLGDWCGERFLMMPRKAQTSLGHFLYLVCCGRRQDKRAREIGSA